MPAALVVPVAAPLGALAVLSPAAAVAVVIGLGFVGIAVASLAAGLALFTALTFFALIPGIGSAVVSVVKVAGGVLLFSLGRKTGRPSLLRDHPLVGYLALLFVAWTVASAVWAPDDTAVRGPVITLTLSVILLFVVYAAVRQPREVRWLVRGYVSGAVLSAVVGPAITSPDDTDTARFSGSIGDPNVLALLLVPGLALAFFALAGARGALERALLLLGACVIAVALFETGSRGGLVALAVAFGAALVLGGRLRGRVLVALLVLATLGVGYYSLAAPQQVVDRVTDFTASGGSGRSDLWSVATSVFHDHPLGGVGAGNFTVVQPAYAARTTNLPAVRLLVDDPHVVHNSYLELLAELGIVGFALFLSVVGGALALGWRAVRAFARAGDDEMELVARGVLVGLSGMLAASFFLSFEYEKQLWLLLGLSATLSSVSGAAVRERRDRRLKRPLVASGTALAPSSARGCARPRSG
jgi:O-antigen ligase